MHYLTEAAINYYPFHIGDYASATRHLSWDEDAAYRRLLDVYYTHEKPIQEAKAMRMAGAQTKSQRDAVATVLAEFFVLGEDGWRHERCDAEIDSMRVKQAQQEEKDAHETDRMRRYRERRSQMFEALRAVQIVPAWDVPMKELQRLFDTHCNANSNAPATHLQREQAVSVASPATAIPTPTPTPTPTPISLMHEEPSGSLSKPSFPTCPHEKILELWSKKLPSLAQPRVWEGQRRTTMRNRWVQAGKPSAYSPEGYSTVEGGLQWWDSFFGYIASDTKLTAGFESNGHTWRPDLEWVVNASNFQKIIDGKYNK